MTSRAEKAHHRADIALFSTAPSASSSAGSGAPRGAEAEALHQLVLGQALARVQASEDDVLFQLGQGVRERVGGGLCMVVGEMAFMVGGRAAGSGCEVRAVMLGL